MTTIIASGCAVLQPAASEPATLEVSSPSLSASLSAARSLYLSSFQSSRRQHENAVEFMPGGNTRSVLFTQPFPIVMKKGCGNRLWDLDGNEYIDLVGELTAGLYGHSNPILKQTLLSTYESSGVNLGATTVEETRFAELICQRFSSVKQLRFCNSGTEANLYALSIARHVTGKRKILVFDGAYHGGVLSFGHGIAPNNVDREDWVLGIYNDVEGAKRLIETTPDLAAVIVEGMQGAGGCLPASVEFLQAIQRTAKQCGVLFILDEVMTSRLHPGGLQGKYSLDPDLTTLGKYLGGGLAFGAFGGKEALLCAYDPRLQSSLPHSGTFNNNTLAMSCGFVGLSQIYSPEAATQLNALGDLFRGRLQEISKGTKMAVTGVGAVLTIHFLSDGVMPIRASDLEDKSITGLKKLFWYWCVGKGFWITERGMLSIILDTTPEELDSFIATVREFIQTYKHLVLLEQ